VGTHITLITDGRDPSRLFTRKSVAKLLEKYRKSIKGSFVIDCIGVGEDPNISLLSDIARSTGGSFWYADGVQHASEVIASYAARKVQGVL
jgi:Mg-chelatase subunit ChlD